jgi:pimeloyl-ACP methyl ester carboxylesterase|tara:strand:- start:592 stop:1443 length:852 start_codon:yes stop_codon:yes gene_type:complete
METHWEGIPKLPNCEGKEEWIKVSEKVSLRVFIWKPNNKSLRELSPIVMVPGWGSVFEGWKPLLSEWVGRRPIIYIETREKSSAIFETKMKIKDFQMSNFTNDITEIIRILDLKNDVHFFSSSLGSTILIDGLQSGTLDGRSSIFLAPNQRFKFPLWARILIKMPFPNFSLKCLIKAAIWGVERKVKEEGQKIRYRRTLLSQNFERIRLSARYLMKYSLPDNLSNIIIPCAIITADSDKLHELKDVERIADRIPNAKMIQVPSNQYAHEPDVLKEIEEFHASI